MRIEDCFRPALEKVYAANPDLATGSATEKTFRSFIQRYGENIIGPDQWSVDLLFRMMNEAL
jgi:hypothetical protein